MLLVETNIQFCISPSLIFQWYDGLRTFHLLGALLKICIGLLSILMMSLPILNWFWVLFTCFLWNITSALFLGLSFRCNLLKKRFFSFSISWSCLSESAMTVISSVKSRLTSIRWLYMNPYPSAVMSTFSWSIKSANSGPDNGLPCLILSSMSIVSVWPSFVAIVVFRFWFNFYIIVHSLPNRFEFTSGLM